MLTFAVFFFVTLEGAAVLALLFFDEPPRNEDLVVRPALDPELRVEVAFFAEVTRLLLVAFLAEVFFPDTFFADVFLAAVFFELPAFFGVPERAATAERLAEREVFLVGVFLRAAVLVFFLEAIYFHRYRITPPLDSAAVGSLCHFLALPPDSAFSAVQSCLGLPSG